MIRPLLGQRQSARKHLADAVRVGDIRLEGTHGDHGHCSADARVKGGQPHGLVAAAAGAGHAQPLGIDEGQALEEVKAATVVLNLGPEKGLTETEECRADLGPVVLVLTRDRPALPGAKGVDHQDDETVAGEQMAARGDARGDLALSPVAMRPKDGRERP